MARRPGHDDDDEIEDLFPRLNAVRRAMHPRPPTVEEDLRRAGREDILERRRAKLLARRKLERGE
jgi:hypothetical protein